MSNLSDIGFPTPGDQDINEMIMHVLEFAKPIQCEQGFYLKFSDASGAEIYFQGNFDQELVGFNPHFAGKSRRKVGLTQKIERDSSELDGGFHGWANPFETRKKFRANIRSCSMCRIFVWSKSKIFRLTKKFN